MAAAARNALKCKLKKKKQKKKRGGEKNKTRVQSSGDPSSISPTG